MPLVNYEKKGRIVTVTLNRPERLNALNKEMLAGLRDAWKAYASDTEASAAILTGTGRAFSAGLDVNDLSKPALATETGVAPARVTDDDTTGAMSQVEKPIIVAINGLALAAGCILVMRSDIRIAAETATLGMPEINIGLYGGVDMLIAQGIPLCTVMEMALTGKPISAQRACEVGLINRVVPDAELMPAAIQMAEAIAAQPPLAIRLNKRVALEALKPSPEVSALRDKVFDSLLTSEDFHEATKAFKEKRKAVFKGK